MRQQWMLPALAIVDPDLAIGVPASITAATGLDAITQLIEPYVSLRANPLVDAMALQGLRLAARSLPKLLADGRDREARAGMACAALMSGICLANAGLGVVHGLAAPIGGMFPAPHGAVCAALLPHGIAANIRALRERAPASPALSRYATVATILDAESLASSSRIPGLRAYGVTTRDFDGLCERAARTSSMKANPVELTAAELRGVLESAL
jgi:alcohol dehydrogenase class IV